GAGRGGGGGGPFRRGAPRNVPGGKRDERGDDEEGRATIRPGLKQCWMPALDDLEPADAVSDDDANPRRVEGSDPKAAGGRRHRRRFQCQLNEPAAFLQVLLVEPAQRIEALDFASKARRIPRRVEECYGGNSRAPAENPLPRLFRADAKRRHEPDAGDDDTPSRASGSTVTLVDGQFSLDLRDYRASVDAAAWRISSDSRGSSMAGEIVRTPTRPAI